MSHQAVALPYLESYQEVQKVQQAMDEKYNELRLNYLKYERISDFLDYLTENELEVPEKVIQDLNDYRKKADVLNNEFDQLVTKEKILGEVLGDYRNLQHVLIMLMQEKGLTFETLAEQVKVKVEKLINLGNAKYRLTLNELKRICDQFQLDFDLYKKYVALK